MIKKNSICKLIKNVKTLITSDEFRTKHSLEDNAFTRNRKLSFQDIISFILGLPRKSPVSYTHLTLPTILRV